ncbi:MAG: hypothetical protein ACHRHE_05590, partial [Tepidisphaerales bacterium]
QRIDQTAACELADRSMNADMHGWNLLTKGIADYRRGNYAAAVRFLQQCRENLRPPRASVSLEYYQVATAATASAEFVSAMACHRLKQPGEASAAMARGMALMDDLPRAGVDDLTNPFQELLICHVFRREAEQLAAGKAGEIFVQFEIPANADVVAETHGTGKPACTAGIDGNGACLLSESEARYRCGNPNRGKGRGFGDGLPDDGRIGPVKLLPYDGNNVVRQTDATPVDIKTPAGNYKSITVHACAGSDTNRAIMGCVVTLELKYATGRAGTAEVLVPDWFARPEGATYLIEGLDRTRWSFQGTVDNGFDDCNAANIFSLSVDADPQRTLTGIRMVRKGPGIVDVFAVTGMAIGGPAIAKAPEKRPGIGETKLTPPIATPIAPRTPTTPVPPTVPVAILRPKPAEYPQWARKQTAAVLDQLERDGDFATARETLADMFDQVIAWAPRSKLDPFRDAAMALRMVRQLEQAPADRRIPLLKYLRANPDLAATLVFLVGDSNKVESVYTLLDYLREKRSKQLASYPALAAAICVVHDRPLTVRINENTAKAGDPLAIFHFYASNESRLAVGIRAIPAELMIHVVDTTATVEEMNWALEKYGRSFAVGSLYSAVKYDTMHVRAGMVKRVTTEGFNLQNILLYGGVCVDQAYFASTAGKALGVPTAIVSGDSAEAAHAWLGFFQYSDARWNFDVGRFESYKGVQGQIIDPQTRGHVPDTHVGLLAEMAATNPQGRQTARALTDAVWRVMEVTANGSAFVPRGFEAAEALSRGTKPIAAAEMELELIELAVRLSPGDRHCWEPLEKLAAAGSLTLADKKHWTSLLQTLYGGKYPDFTLAMIVPMVRTVESVKEQDPLWEWLFNAVKSRADLAAAVRMEQGAMWESTGALEKARACYMDVIDRYATAGPFVLAALRRAEDGLRLSGKAASVPGLYESTWMRLSAPRDKAPQFLVQSNWFRIGRLLAEKLDEAGQKEKAAAVRDKLGVKAKD